MCRFVMYMGPPISLDQLITLPDHSIIHQSFKSRLREEPLNGDGFGVAWYAPDVTPEPAAYRSIRPAWNDQNLLNLARVTRSGIILAHVRAATNGMSVSEANCHPFTAGKLAFMHNGAIGDFLQIKRKLQQQLQDASFLSINGTTDSEHFFALYRDHYFELAELESTPRLAAALDASLTDLLRMLSEIGSAKTTALNVAVTDGRSAVISRFTTNTTEGPSLFIDTSRKYLCDDGEIQMVGSPDHHETVLVASEPLNEEPGWEPVPRNHMLVIDPNHTVKLEPLTHCLATA